MNTYLGHIQYEAVGICVKARNKREAKKRILEKAKKRRPKIDRNNFFID